MHFHITLPHFNARYNFPTNCASDGAPQPKLLLTAPIAIHVAGRIAAHFAASIAAFSRSAGKELLTAASLILVAILAPCVPVYASPYEAGEMTGRVAPAQGSSKMKAVIDVRTSPAVYLPGPAFRIEVYSANPVTQGVLERLQEGIEQVLLMNDPRLRVARVSADTSIACTITDLNISPRIEVRSRPEYRYTGQVVVTDSQTGVSSTVDQYAYVDVSYRVMVVDGRISVKWDVTDVATGILLFKDRVDAGYTYEAGPDLGAGPIVGSSLSSVDLNIAELKLADKAAVLILGKLSPKFSSEIVALSSGKLKEASTLLQSGLWSEALTMLSNMPAFKDSKDDAYRLYSIGVAQEALAYQTIDVVERNALLERAVGNYVRAAELKPKENMFWTPKNRAEGELASARELVAQLQALEKVKQRAVNGTSLTTTDLLTRTRHSAQSSATAINNQTVIQLVKSGRSADFIIASIKHAPATQFDLSEAERLKLRREGVSNDVLKAMLETQAERRPSTLVKTLWSTAALLWWLPFILR
jgi:hypothetical protein